MSSITRRTGPATTYLVHFFGGGLLDRGECYAVERFRAHVDGDIRRWPAGPSARTNGRARPAPEIASADEVRELRPAYNEIIVSARLTGASAAGESPARRKGYVMRTAAYMVRTGRRLYVHFAKTNFRLHWLYAAMVSPNARASPLPIAR